MYSRSQGGKCLPMFVQFLFIFCIDSILNYYGLRTDGKNPVNNDDWTRWGLISIYASVRLPLIIQVRTISLLRHIFAWSNSIVWFFTNWGTNIRGIRIKILNFSLEKNIWNCCVYNVWHVAQALIRYASSGKSWLLNLIVHSILWYDTSCWANVCISATWPTVFLIQSGLLHLYTDCNYTQRGHGFNQPIVA